MKFILVALAMTAGNFIYQVFKKRDWERAFEISFFQAVAIGVLWLNGAR